MKLTSKQETFAQAVAAGKTQTDAYREAYGCKAWKENIICQRASELANSGKVSVRIAELKEELAKKRLWTREMSVGILGKIATAKESSSMERISAVKELNNMHGFNAPNKLEIVPAGDLSINYILPEGFKKSE